MNNPFQQIIQRACSDAAYRARLISNPRQAIWEEGVLVPDGVQVEVHESRDDRLLIVLPGPNDLVMADEERSLPSGVVADVPSHLKLTWAGNVLVAEGRIDSVSAPALKRELMKALDAVDLELSRVTFMSSAGISALMSGGKHLNEHRARLRLVAVPEIVRNVLEISGMIEVFELIDESPLRDPLFLAL